MSQFSKLNGYSVKDETARQNIEELNNTLNNNITEINNKFNEVDNSIKYNIEQLESKYNTINYHNYPKRLTDNEAQRYYIDGINGNDNNPGSDELPFKTIDKFFEMLNKGQTDIRCYIVSAGTYIATKTVFSNCVIHLNANVGGVIIEFQNDDVDTAFYNCHLNISGVDNGNCITLRNSTDTKKIYFENCATILYYTIIENCLSCSAIGGNVQAYYLTLPNIYLDSTKYDINNLTITKSTERNNIFIRQGSVGVLRGALSVINVDASSLSTTNIIHVERSILMLYMSIANQSPVTSGKGLNCNQAIIHCSETMLSLVEAIASGNSFTNTTRLLGNSSLT